MDCSGSAMMYSTKDFASWSYEGLLASQPGIEPASECSAASNGENCDQFGKGCHSWECPDYFAVPGEDGAYALKWSDQVGLPVKAGRKEKWLCRKACQPCCEAFEPCRL